ncbi:MAG: radical SAM protein [Deltaproteobacteria bacterium]|jgi:MoaA/NifB/PqqE/SkfB family radical SAM enzyme|nr:radical SAM protein [Deltaproteobacteria bacterium]
MIYIFKRGYGILKKDGISKFILRFFDYFIKLLQYKLNSNSDKKNANWFKYISDLESRAEILTCTPWKLGFETTSMCNLQCIMCLHVFSPLGNGKHFDLEKLTLFEDYIARAGEFQLMGCGEPLISPAFWKIMEYIKQTHKVKPRMAVSSNAVALNKTLADRILESPLDEISFSLDATKPETYKKIRNSNLDKTISNIRYLLEQKRKLSLKKPLVILNMTLMKENLMELNSLVLLAHELGADAVSFWPLHDYNSTETSNWRVERNGWVFSYREQMLGQDEEQAELANAEIAKALQTAQAKGIELVLPVGGLPKFVEQKKADTANQAVSLEQISISSSAAQTSEKSPALPETSSQPMPTAGDVAVRHSLRECVSPWEWMAVSECGEVHACCYQEQSCGNIGQSTLEEIWNGPVYREMRRSLANNILPEVCKNAACKYVRSYWMYNN